MATDGICTPSIPPIVSRLVRRKLTGARAVHHFGRVHGELEHIASNDFHDGVLCRGCHVLPLHFHSVLPRIEHVKRRERLLFHPRHVEGFVWKTDPTENKGKRRGINAELSERETPSYVCFYSVFYVLYTLFSDLF